MHAGVATPEWCPGAEPMAFTDADRAAMPGVVAQHPPRLDDATALLFALVKSRLKRVVTDAGSGDRQFLHDTAKLSPHDMSARQLAHVMRLAWKYRFQLPGWLRPGADPDVPRHAAEVSQ